MATAPSFTQYAPPKEGQPLTVNPNGTLTVPDDPVIPHLEGDGIGVDISPVMRHVLDAAVKKAYGGRRRLCWFEIYAGEKAVKQFEAHIPDDTFEAIRFYKIGIKGPLTTPVGGGIRSLNVTFRQVLDLYACVRPVKWIPGLPSPMKRPDLVDMVLYRENTEDVYAGIEWPAGSPEAKKLAEFIQQQLGKKMPHPDSGIGIKPMSAFGSKRLIRAAIQYAIRRKRSSVTLIHKGNIMKFTEGAFTKWGYELARDEFAGVTVTETEVWEQYGGKVPEGKVVMKDRIADAMFQQVLLRPDEYSVLATTNLNGDYLSDAISAQASGLGLAPSSNFSDEIGWFEATHGSAPKYAGQDKVNPSALVLTGGLLLEHLGWPEAANLVVEAIARTIKEKIVTYDLARMIEGAREVKCSAFGDAVVKNMG